VCFWEPFRRALFVEILAGFALLLPRDATGEVLRPRGKSADAQQLTGRPSVLAGALQRSRRAAQHGLDPPSARALAAVPRRDHVRRAETGDAVLLLIPARDDLVVAAVQYPWRSPRARRMFSRFDKPSFAAQATFGVDAVTRRA
jgi:hypothetical protein